jgi:alpha-beta hydrolase superfamily lysophospholipase
MAAEPKYRAENVGDWGVPTAAAGGVYGTDALTTADGTTIFVRFWQAADPTAPVLVLAHGLGAHTGWFIDMGNELNARGLTVYMNDHRGFGRSGGPRGHVRRGAVYLDDLSQVVDEVRKRRPGAPLFLLGHSMGAIFALHTAARDAAGAKARLKGLILVNPWVRDFAKVTPGLALRVFGGGLLGSSQLVRASGGPEVMTASEEATAMLNADSFWVRAQSAAFLLQVTRLRTQMLRLAGAVRIPALVIQSEQDRSVVPAASRRAYEALGSTDKTWKSYPVYAHDFEFEPARAQLDDDLADWIMRHRA